MIYGSVCSGIEAATVAWHQFGWRAAFYSEIEPAPCALLKHYYPDVPNHGDMTLFKAWPDATLDLLVGGTPCQSFSVAGLRKGLADPRGNLTLTYLAVADKYRPRWLVWENADELRVSVRLHQHRWPLRGLRPHWRHSTGWVHLLGLHRGVRALASETMNSYSYASPAKGEQRWM